MKKEPKESSAEQNEFGAGRNGTVDISVDPCNVTNAMTPNEAPVRRSMDNLGFGVDLDGTASTNVLSERVSSVFRLKRAPGAPFTEKLVFGVEPNGIVSITVDQINVKGAHAAVPLFVRAEFDENSATIALPIPSVLEADDTARYAEENN